MLVFARRGSMGNVDEVAIKLLSMRCLLCLCLPGTNPTDPVPPLKRHNCVAAWPPQYWQHADGRKLTRVEDIVWARDPAAFIPLDNDWGSIEGTLSGQSFELWLPSSHIQKHLTNGVARRSKRFERRGVRVSTLPSEYPSFDQAQPGTINWHLDHYNSTLSCINWNSNNHQIVARLLYCVMGAFLTWVSFLISFLGCPRKSIERIQHDYRCYNNMSLWAYTRSSSVTRYVWYLKTVSCFAAK